uniref:Uncharacterized protein n=1 Tax=Arundo donax TaxID=35708 RepID=A0A0A9HNC3_ARUDO
MGLEVDHTAIIEGWSTQQYHSGDSICSGPQFFSLTT